MNDSSLGLSISCDTCVMQHTSSCSDCLVTFLCADEGSGAFQQPVTIARAVATDAVVLDLDELRAVRLLASAGLVPTLRHREAI